MRTKESIDAIVTIRVVEGPEPQQILATRGERAESCGPLFRFAGNSPATFAERFPHLMVFAVAASVILVAITAEVECLRAMGYYWP